MDTLIHADIFFFVTTIAVVVALVLFAIFMYYLIQISRNFRDISDIFKKGVKNSSNQLNVLFKNIKDNPLFNFIFNSKKKKSKTKK